MYVNICNIFLCVVAFVRNGIKYCLTEIFHAQTLVSFYRQLRIMSHHHFYTLCALSVKACSHTSADLVSTL
jgi:hypothetical protein